ncbi:MAG: Holliday junction resolvase RuvX [Spirochaetia bacterium]|nr:Holliday junction resolvase RuvX [Spirochaetia bacterium]
MGRLLAVDFGRKYIGLAVTSEDQIAITNLESLEFHKTNFWENFFSVIKEYKPLQLIIGMPYSTGEKSNILKEIKNFGRHIEKNIPNISIVYWDENFTSIEAENIFIEKSGKSKTSRKKQKEKKEKTHSMAAHLILKSYIGSSE